MKTQIARMIGCTLVLTALVGSAAAQTEVKFTLDWLPQGPHSIFIMAQDNNHFAKEKLNVKMDRGFGSGDSIAKVAAGTYDIGAADINAVVKFNADNPGNRVIGFYQYYDNTLAVVVARAASGVKTPSDLEGKTIASPEGEGSRLMFPAFARANGFDATKVKWLTVTPQMREPLLLQGRVDAVGGFTSTTIINLEQLGMKENDIVPMPYAKFGLDLYGSTLITTPAYAERNPEVVKGFIKAIIAGTRDALRDPALAMAALKKRDPLLDEKVELKRLVLVRDTALLTPFIQTNGFGTVVPERMEKLIKINAEAYGIANPPKPAELYTTKFLPPADQRMP